MANIRKSFSFRNGVQVDEDNFSDNAYGLVGIGTAIPNEALDVRGTAKVVGLTTTNDLFVAGVATATDIKLELQFLLQVVVLRQLIFMVMVQLYQTYLHHNGKILI